MNQKTIAREGILSGIGLHTGKIGNVALKPAPVDSGIQFYRDGARLDGSPTMNSRGSWRCSSVGDGKRSLLTVEHLLAAIYGLGITNVQIEVEGPEIPALDGSARLFVKWIKKLGIFEQKKQAFVYKVKEPVFCGEAPAGSGSAFSAGGGPASGWGGKAIVIYPAESFSVSYVMNYPHPFLSNQKVDFEITPKLFENQVAPARTFITEEEAKEVKKRGLGLGGSEENTLLIRRDGTHRKKMRFKDECARHKVLDIVGDLALLGFPIKGRVIGLRSGHALNRKLACEIKKQKEGKIAYIKDLIT